MKRIIHFIVVKLTLVFALGIGIAFYMGTDILLPGILLGLGIILTLATYFKTRQHFHQKIWFGCCIYIVTFILGWFTFSIHQENKYPTHYTQTSYKTKFPQELTITISETLKPSQFYQRYIGKITSINTKPCIGNVLIQLSPKTSSPITNGTELIAITTIKTIPKALNPYQFNYRTYLKHQQVYGKITLANNYTITQQNTDAALTIRKTILTNLKNNGLTTTDLALTSALFLGDKNYLSEELYTSYVNAGVIHLLAISGLHIGILMVLLQYICYPLRYFSWGKPTIAVITLAFLWWYAWLTGLSPSVVRSVTMFSCMAVALQLKRPQNTIHIVALSAFTTLLIYPDMLFSIGFQLSYTAVAGILIIQPLLNTIWQFKNSILNYLKNLITVMLAAQLAVLPLSIYYFHQFPLLFMIGNICIIPFITLFVSFGFITVLLSWAAMAPAWCTQLMHYGFTLINTIVTKIATVEGNLITHIYFDNTLAVLCYVLLGFILYTAFTKNTRYLTYTLAICLSIQGYLFWVKYRNETLNAFLVFHHTGSTVIGIHANKQLHLYSQQDIANLAYLLPAYTTQTQCSVTHTSFQNVFIYGNQTILVINSATAYTIPNHPIDYIVISNAPKVNPERILLQLRPKKLIIDGNNYPSTVINWKKACYKYHIALHNTAEKGTFILK